MALAMISRSRDLLVMEQSYGADAQPPPLHLHPGQDEHFDVLEGEIAATIDGEARVYRAGESFDVPRGTVHTMGPRGAPARIRWEVRPALRTWEFLTEMPSEPAELVAHVQRHAAEFRLAEM